MINKTKTKIIYTMIMMICYNLTIKVKTSQWVEVKYPTKKLD